MSYQIFLDDERVPSYYREDRIICRSYRNATRLVHELGLPYHVDFDHDLGEDVPTGYDFAKFLVEYHLEYNIVPTLTWSIHSQNPVGRENIDNLMRNLFLHGPS